MQKVGFGRSIGQKSRAIVAERAADGTERRIDTLHNVQDGTAFDDEWENNELAAQMDLMHHRMPALSDSRLQTGLLGDTFGHLLQGFAHNPPVIMAEPEQDEADRETARLGRLRYEAERDRMIAEARSQQRRQPRQRSRFHFGHRRDDNDADAEFAANLARLEDRRF